MSQAVFAAVLNTSVSTVQKWEIGEKRPSGPSLKLLTGSSGYDAGRAGARMPSASQPVPHERWHD